MICAIQWLMVYLWKWDFKIKKFEFMNMQFQSSEIRCQNFRIIFPRRVSRQSWLRSRWTLAAKGVRIQEWDLLRPLLIPARVRTSDRGRGLGGRWWKPGERRRELPRSGMELAANAQASPIIKTLHWISHGGSIKKCIWGYNLCVELIVC